MNYRGFISWSVIAIALAFAASQPVSAQTNCDEGNGPLNSAKPAMDPQEIIQKFAAREAIFKEARNHYTYTQEIVVQTLDGDSVDGEFRQKEDVTYDDKGARIETVTFAPMDTLKRIMMTREDFDDVRNRAAVCADYRRSAQVRCDLCGPTESG